MRGKQIKGEKYIYLAMAYKLISHNKDKGVNIGNDDGVIGGQHYYRYFRSHEYGGERLLIETKGSAGGASFSRVFVISDGDGFKRPFIFEYLNEARENGSTSWEH